MVGDVVRVEAAEKEAGADFVEVVEAIQVFAVVEAGMADAVVEISGVVAETSEVVVETSEVVAETSGAVVETSEVGEASTAASTVVGVEVAGVVVLGNREGVWSLFLLIFHSNLI